MSTATNTSEQRKTVLAFITTLVSLVALTCILVAYSVLTATQNTNDLDNTRTRSTAIAALNSLPKQTDALIRDNAWWDDAANAAYKSTDNEWMISEWGESTLEYPLYNQAIVIERDGTPVIAYSYGKELTWTLDEYYGPSFRKMLSKVVADEGINNDAPVISGFTNTPEGPTILSISPILPFSEGTIIEHQKKRYLIFSRQITPQMMSNLSKDYLIPKLQLEAKPKRGSQYTSVYDANGQPVAYLTWPAQLPGNAAFSSILPYLMGALSLFALLIICLITFTRFLIQRLKKDHAKAQHDATHDQLSGLLNRSGLFSAMAKLNSRINVGAKPTLIYLDLDGFKDVNDSYGHLMGDALIRNVATKLVELSPKYAHVSRLGGDEFALLLDQSMPKHNPDQISNAIHDLFKTPFIISGRTMTVGASLGVVCPEGTNTSPEEMVRQADVAMYRAKDMGRGKTVVYQASFDADRIEQNALEQDLRETLGANGLDVVFQPLVDAKTSKWLGVEALSRWHNKRLNRAIDPNLFITIAERSGLIEILGLQILRKALTAADKWPNLKVCVNVSPAQFRNPAFPDHVARILHDTNFDPKLLSLEITEGFFIRNPERAQRIVSQLKTLGISIALDDFGSGYSSIGYLRQFAFDRLKIDRSFITALDSEANAPSVIHATVALANAFDIPVTAEGVEREEQASILRLTGCDEFQGFLFGRPMIASEIDRILIDQNQMAAA